MWFMNLHSLLGHRCVCPAAAPTVVASRCSRRGSCQHAGGCRRGTLYRSCGRECFWPSSRQKQFTRSQAASVSAPSASPELSVPRGETAGAAFLLEGVTVQVWFQCVSSSKFFCGAGNSCVGASNLRLVNDSMFVLLQAGDRDLLVDVDWISMPGHRVGLVGANGEVHRGIERLADFSTSSRQV